MRASPRAIKLAADLRRDLGFQERFIDLATLLKEMEVDLRVEDLPEGIEGLTRGNQIIVDPSNSEERRRFTIAHELGHHLLGHGQVTCSAAKIHGASADPLEAEANTFSSALLMPGQLFRTDTKKVHPRFCEIEDVAKSYGVSITAASIRYVGFSSDLCALVGVRTPKDVWITKSWEQGWFLAIPPRDGTLIYSSLRGGTVNRDATVPARLWFENYERKSESTIREEVLKTSGSSWLALLSEIPDFDDDANIEEREAEEDLERRRKSFRMH